MSTKTLLEHTRHYVDGQWQEPHGTKVQDVINPATEEVLGRVTLGDQADVDRAVEAARVAFETWSQTEPSERGQLMGAIGARLAERGDEVAALIAKEVGTPLRIAKIVQAGLPATTFGSMPKLLDEVVWEEEVGNSTVVREPVGVVGAITPWNYPLHQIAAKVAPALATGCTVVLKPSTVTPLNAFLLAEVIDDVGLPAGVFNLVVGSGPAVGEPLALHPDVDMISFTGSTLAGRRVSELASATVKRVALELGGKSANILLEDAPLPKAALDGIGKCFLNSGQTCSALTRMLVPRSRLAEVEEIVAAAVGKSVVGDPFEETTVLGPLVSGEQRDRVTGYIRQGVEEGAKLLVGGPEPPEGREHGFYVQPTVFSEVRPEMTIAQEEIFGPVLVIMPYDDEDEAVSIANGTVYGLAGGVWSADEEHATRVARRLRTGQVEVNGGAFNPMAPFGGYKQSGHGRELGRFGLEEFLTIKAIQH